MPSHAVRFLESGHIHGMFILHSQDPGSQGSTIMVTFRHCHRGLKHCPQLLTSQASSLPFVGCLKIISTPFSKRALDVSKGTVSDLYNDTGKRAIPQSYGIFYPYKKAQSSCHLSLEMTRASRTPKIPMNETLPFCTNPAQNQWAIIQLLLDFPPLGSS